MASSERQCKKLRNWNNSDSLDPSDLCQLYETEKLSYKSGRSWRSYLSFYFVFIGFLTLFLFGVLVGFYVRESQKVSGTCNSEPQRKDGLDHAKIQSVHQNIMYYLSSKSIESYQRKLEDLQKAAVSLNFHDDPQSTNFIASEFRKFGLDSVKTEEQQVVVTYSDASRPNKLEFLGNNGTVTRTVTLERKNAMDGKGDNLSSAASKLLPFAAFSPSGVAEGKLVYANHGQYSDYLRLRSINVSVAGAVVLIRHGKTSNSRKVQLAERYGAKGVLLYCHPDDCPDVVAGPQLTSVADFSEDEPYYPTIPVQTVSQNLAAEILKNISETSLPSSWLSSVRKLLRKMEDKSQLNTSSISIREVRVRLSVNSISSSVVVQNIIGTIQGGTESDRHVLVGASRSSDISNNTRVSTNTAVLLELARSLAYIRRTEGWIPGRGIKICSWGGGVLSNLGVNSYILNNKGNLQGSTVASINLDFASNTREVKIVASPGFTDLVKNVAQMVPDPRNGGYSTGDSWPELGVKDLLLENSSMTAYSEASVERFPFLSLLGVSSIQLRSKAISSMEEAKSNQKYLLSHARVVALLLSELSDHQYLPFSVTRYAEFVRMTIERSLDQLKQYCSRNSTDSLLKAVREVEDCSSEWSQVSHAHKRCRSELQVRKINNVLQSLDSHFVGKLPHDSTSYLLSYNRSNGLLDVFNSANEEFTFTGDSERLNTSMSALISSLENLSSSICQLKLTLP